MLSKVDLSKGFHQVEVAVEDRDKTCFVCPFRKFRFRRMPFGLTQCPISVPEANGHCAGRVYRVYTSVH